MPQTEDQKPIENKPEGGRSGRPSNRSTSRVSIIIRTTHRADDRAIVPRYHTEGIPDYLDPTMVNHACPRARAPIVPPSNLPYASTPAAHSLAYARFVPSFARRRRSRQRRNIREHSSTSCRHRRISHLLARQSSTPCVNAATLRPAPLER